MGQFYLLEVICIKIYNFVKFLYITTIQLHFLDTNVAAIFEIQPQSLLFSKLKDYFKVFRYI